MHTDAVVADVDLRIDAHIQNKVVAIIRGYVRKEDYHHNGRHQR
jgi:hypothetical protein